MREVVWLFSCLVIFWLGMPVFGDSFSVIHDLNSQKEYSAVILMPKVFNYKNKTQHVFLDPKTEKVVVLPDEYKLEKEIKTFKSFREKYQTYWTIYNAMFLMRILWLD